MPLPQKKGDAVRSRSTRRPREDTSLEALAKLKPAFKEGGTVTAGNAPGVNDGAAALVVTSAERAQALGRKPMARIVAQAVSGLEPSLVMMTPVEAVRKLWKKTGWSAADVDLVELNEAFAVQAVAVIRELGLDPAKVNVNGGAVALGHPIGASGARILTTLLYALATAASRAGSPPSAWAAATAWPSPWSSSSGGGPPGHAALAQRFVGGRGFRGGG